MKNIIFITADQLAARWLGCYGSGVDSTPTLDRLAAEGVRFERCYATFPVCAPNRATMLTGRSPVVHGITTNNYVLRTDMPTYAHVLQRQGYRTGGFGKFHQTPMHMPVGDMAHLGFDESVVSDELGEFRTLRSDVWRQFRRPRGPILDRRSDEWLFERG